MDWEISDYEAARDFVESNEEEIGRVPVVDCGKGLTAVLPLGTPAVGVRFHGAVMLAPIPLFMLCAALVPVFGFSGSWSLSATTLGITFGCALMVLGLARAGRLVLNQRELFPRKFFSTLGKQGVAMHFPFWYFPFSKTRKKAAWGDVASVSPATAFFLPGLLTLQVNLPVFRATTRDGGSVLLFRPGKAAHQEELKRLIESARR